MHDVVVVVVAGCVVCSSASAFGTFLSSFLRLVSSPPVAGAPASPASSTTSRVWLSFYLLADAKVASSQNKNKKTKTRHRLIIAIAALFTVSRAS